jgi:hypothetical protein
MISNLPGSDGIVYNIDVISNLPGSDGIVYNIDMISNLPGSDDYLSCLYCRLYRLIHSLELSDPGRLLIMSIL